MMKLIEDRKLDEVAGAETPQEVLDFTERVLRELRRLQEQPVEPAPY